MQCEICGKEGAGNIIILDGSQLIVCKDCSGFGKEVKKKEKPKEIPKRPEKKEPERESFIEEIRSITLVDNYGKLVKREREKKGLTIKELAAKIFEKESLLHKIEKGHFTPENKLVKKLEKELGIDLIEQIGNVDFEQKKERGKITLGDLVRKKNR